MSKLVVLEIDAGDSQGFPVKLKISEEGKPVGKQIEGRLPPATDLEQSYEQWRLKYHRCLAGMRALEHEATQTTHLPADSTYQQQIRACRSAETELKNRLDTWLQPSSNFSKIRERISNLNADEEIRVIVQTDNHLFWKLPWNLWGFLTDSFRKAEISVSKIEYDDAAQERKKKQKLRILVKKQKLRILVIFWRSSRY